jgi:hypothetical protein
MVLSTLVISNGATLETSDFQEVYEQRTKLIASLHEAGLIDKSTALSLFDTIASIDERAEKTVERFYEEPEPGPAPIALSTSENERVYAYAETEDSFPFCYGDVNGDSSINSTDYALLKRFLLSTADLTSTYGKIAADINLDDNINSTDYTVLRRYLLGIINELPFTDQSSSIVSASTYEELKSRLGVELKKHIQVITAIYTGEVDNLQQNVKEILSALMLESGINGSIGKYSFSASGQAGSMALRFRFEYKESSTTDMDMLKQRIMQYMQSYQTSVKIPIGTNIDEVIQSLEGIISQILEDDEYLKEKYRTMSGKITSGQDSYVLELSFEYSTTKEQEDFVTSKTREILQEILRSDMDESQKEKEIHDYIVTHIVYDDELINATAYDALSTGRATCDGYAELTCRMLQEAGIESEIVKSSDHAWNLIKIEGIWYHMDCTWDAGLYEQRGELLYDYYNLSDTEMQEFQSWNTSEHPVANTRYFEFLKNKNMDKYALLLREISIREERGIFFLMDNIEIYPGDSKRLPYRAILKSDLAQSLIWTSSDSSVVTVQDGAINSIKEGKAIITATAGEYTASCTVHVAGDGEVVEDPTGITFEAHQISMDVRETRKLVHYALPARGYPGNIMWVSSNPYIVTVKDGYVTAFSEGVAEITAIMDGVYQDKCQITVSRKIPLDTSNMESQALSMEVLKELYNEDNTARPEVTIFAKDDINSTTSARNAYGRFKSVAGLVGHAVEIETSSDFAWAELSFSISPETLELNRFEDLTVAWYDPITDSIIPVETERNAAQRKITARITHFSTYMVINSWVLDQLKNTCENVQKLYRSKQADVAIILDNKWAESLINVKKNMINTVEILDQNLDLNVDFMVINSDGSITNYGWYTNKGRPKYAGDYSNIEKLENMKTLRQLKEDIDNVMAPGYIEENYKDGFTEEASEILTRAYTQASNLEGFRSGTSRYIFGFSEIRAEGFFKAVRNSIMIRENETYAFIQRNCNYIFNKYSSNEGQVGIFNIFSEPITNYIIDMAKDNVSVHSTYARMVAERWGRYRNSLEQADSYIKVEKDRYLNLYGICLIDTPAYLAECTEGAVNTLNLTLEGHTLRMKDGQYSIVVKSGDTLGEISRIVSGNAVHWPLIQQENNLGSTVINPGQILDVTRVINDNKIALAIAEKLTMIPELFDYIKNTAPVIPGDIEVYKAKRNLEILMNKVLYNTGKKMFEVNIRNEDGSLDGIWDSKLQKAVDIFVEGIELEGLYSQIEAEEDRKMLLFHWIKMEVEQRSVLSYPVPKEWYERIPEIPRSNKIYGTITAENKYNCPEVKDYYMKYMYPIDRVRNYWAASQNMFTLWAQRLYGLASNEKGNFATGVLEGLLVEYPKDIVTGVFEGIYAICSSPEQTLESIKFMLSALDPINGGDEREILIAMIQQGIESGIDEFMQGDDYTKGKMIGKLLGEVITCFVGVVKGVKAGAQLIRDLKYAGTLSNFIKIGFRNAAGNLKRSADEIVRLIKLAGEILEDIVNYIKKAPERVFEIIKSIFSKDDELKIVAKASDGVTDVEVVISRSKLKKILMDENGMTDEAAEMSIKIVEGGCFSGDTLVMTREGLKRIDKIEEGDYVLSKDVNSGIIDYKEVETVYVKSTYEYVHLKFGNEEIRTTASHLFFTYSGWWKAAENVEVGDSILTSEGGFETVTGVDIEGLYQPGKIYNLSVEDYHTYFVGTNGLLVHNDCSEAMTQIMNKILKATDGEIYDLFTRSSSSHLVERHLNKTINDLVNRALTDPNCGPLASAFTNQSTAIKAIRENLRGNATRIKEWLESSSNVITISFDNGYSLGNGVYKGTSTVVDASKLTKSELFLVKDATSSTGFNIITGYPTL